jgi:sugar lactone lactonase YvrE
MELFRRATQGRARWLAVFTLLLFVASAVPVLADPPSEEQTPPSESEASGSGEPSPLPGGAALEEATKKVEKEEDERAAELASPAAVAEREASELAYIDLESAGAVSDLLRSSFGEELASLELDPARFLSDSTLKRNLGDDGGAVVTSEGKTELIDSEIPAEVPDEDGQMSKVDLSLNTTPEGFEPENPITDLAIPTSAAEGISIGTSGETSITQAGVDPESSAHLFGDKDVIYPEVQTDTDLLVSPLATGVEFSDQLRSIESPETLRFDLSLPEGAELRANSGAAEVYEGERLTAIVAPPHAVDAQGTLVPVTMDVQGTSLILSVAHREGDYAYPILVDPEYTQNDWVNNAWIFYNRYDVLEDSTFLHNSNIGFYNDRWCRPGGPCWGSGRGLFVAVPGGNWGAQQWSQWTYTPPGETSYLSGYLINPFYRYDTTNTACWSDKQPEPHDYDGIWDPTYGYYYKLFTNRALYSNASYYESTDPTGKVMVFGMSTGAGAKDPCWRDIYAGGIATYMTDPDWPTLGAISGQPTGWFDDSKQYGVNVSAHDSGLGVQNITLNIEGAPQVTLQKAPCYGNHDYPCQPNMSGKIEFNGDNFDEGLSLASVVASDALSRGTGGQYFWAYVDSTPPKLALSGQLANATEETEGNSKDPKEWDDLSLPVYNLTVKAEDGNPKYVSNKERRSGVKNIEIYLDKKTEPETVSWKPYGSPCENCEMTQTYPLKLNGLASGKHTLRVVAVDQMNHKSERDIEFEYIPATGMKDEYVMQYFPLPDGQGNEAEEEHPSRPELAVNVMNGNLVYREKDVDVEGYGTDLEVERFYNSQLPDAQNTEWGDGWTLAQTPELEPETDPSPKEAQLLDTSGAVEAEVKLPTEAGKSKFNPALQATVTKEAGGGYELADETGETNTAIAFDSSGRTDELRTDGYAKVDYDYEAGKLDEIAVKDPGSVGDLSEAEEKALEYVPPAPSYKSTFGALGSADGQLKAPGDIAMAANGDLFVVDRGNNRIERFNQEGKFVSKFGTEGTGNGQFKRPCAIAIDSSGNLWVADADNNRIQKFTEAGAFVKAVGVQGTGNVQFNKPEGIATDLKGNVYVADTFNSRIQILNPAGEFISKVGSLGTADGQFNQPVGVDVGPGGTLWVADRGLHRVSKFDAAGKFLLVFGSKGSGDGEFWCPEAMEVDSRGNVFVGDRANNRIEQFSSTGKYLTKFGSQGSGAGQFILQFPVGIVVDNLGGLWVPDVGNHRIQKWSVPNYRPSWFGAFPILDPGSPELLKAPADIAFAANGDVLVVDKGNNRIERFSQEGKFVSKFGSYGTTPGLFSAPTSIALDGSNKLWITDKTNNRVQVFAEDGKFIKAIGGTASGTGEGQFNKPEGVAADGEGHIYVADTYNKRIQVFDEEGKYITKFGTAGSGPGQFTEASAIDVGRDGSIYVADWGANRVQKFNEKYESVLQFGSAGTGDGQFSHPDAVEADGKGNVWVGDQSNGRIELFNEAGEYVTQFGAKGSGEGQFSFASPMGIAADWSGGVWVTDVNNNRIQKWLMPSSGAPKVPEENDPSVDVKLSSGLVSGVEGQEAGVNTYAHTGELLTANKGPDGEVKYVYDASNRLTKVTLPNGTYGSITYNTTYGRVSKVTVDPAGAAPAKSTNFAYEDSPSRRTSVTPEGVPAVTYDIGADGSVLKWWNVKKPPTIENISGSLYSFYTKKEEVKTGVQNLSIKASSPVGIASIQVLTNGTNLVDEATCTENKETIKIECEYPEPDEWVMETEDFVPGNLDLEVLVKDPNGEVSAERFHVTIPQPPPPPPDGLPVKPKFKEIKDFREEFGLEVWDPVKGENELNDRIFDLINAWTAGEPVARASWERWGVPLRTSDVAELEYRENYTAHNRQLIDEWASAHYPNTYAGYYIDNRAGGIMHVGFTQEQSARLAELEQQLPLIATDRLQVYPTPPPKARVDLTKLVSEVNQAWLSNGTLKSLITETGISESKDTVEVGTSNVSQVQSVLAGLFGAQAPITVIYQPEENEDFSSRFKTSGRILAGDNILNKDGACTAGFGAYEDRTNKFTGQPIRARFLLTAGHCFSLEAYVHRSPYIDLSHIDSWTGVGEVTRSAFGVYGQVFETDAEAIRLESDGLAPNFIHGHSESVPIGKPEVVHPGSTVCYSGARTGGVKCKEVISIRAVRPPKRNFLIVGYMVAFETQPGDSGGPVWNPKSGGAVGLVSGGHKHATLVTPMLHPSGGTVVEAPGILNAPPIYPLHLITSE